MRGAERQQGVKSAVSYGGGGKFDGGGDGGGGRRFDRQAGKQGPKTHPLTLTSFGHGSQLPTAVLVSSQPRLGA